MGREHKVSSWDEVLHLVRAWALAKHFEPCTYDLCALHCTWMFKFCETVPYKVIGKGFLGKENKAEVVITDIQGSKFESTKQKTIVQKWLGLLQSRIQRVEGCSSEREKSMWLTFPGRQEFHHYIPRENIFWLHASSEKLLIEWNILFSYLWRKAT